MMKTKENAILPLPVVSFTKGNYKNRFGGNTEFHRYGEMRAFKAQFFRDRGWVFYGHVVDEIWQIEMRFNADPGLEFVAVIQHTDVTSHPIDELLSLIASKAHHLTTEDGIRFCEKDGAGTWTDGDISIGPNVRNYEHVGATIEIVQTTVSDDRQREALTSMGFVDCTLPSGMPALRVCMPAGCAILVSYTMLGLQNDLNGLGVQVLGVDAGGRTLFSKTCHADNFIETVRDSCAGMYGYALALVNHGDLVAECKALVERHLRTRLGFAAKNVDEQALRSMVEQLGDYVQTLIKAGHQVLAPKPDAGEQLEIATMKDLGWVEADGYTKDTTKGARYQRSFGGNGTPFALYQMTIARTDLGWIPIHGSVCLSPVQSPVEAAQVLTQYWASLPVSNKVTHEYTKSLVGSK